MPKKSKLEIFNSASQVTEDSIEQNKYLIEKLLLFIGENPKREGLIDTPRRVLSAWREMTNGYNADIDSILKTQFDHEGYDQMITLTNIEFQSVCEHHLLPFLGYAHVAYIPNQNGPIVGLSKLARLVEAFSKRLQIQERLTVEIANAIDSKLNPRGVGVMLEAKHLCMVCRGVKKMHSTMKTSCLLGVFKHHKVRTEFFNLINTSDKY
jgi:GTP cyclohydrolase I